MVHAKPGAIEVPLTQGFVALVDAADYPLVADYAWGPLHGRTTTYARRSIRLGGRKVAQLMHRLLIPDAPAVDHINGDGLDNRRANLRAATPGENNRHRLGLNRNNTSGYRGVYRHNRSQRWSAQIKLGDKNVYLGLFDTPEDAARARDAASIEHYGEFAGHLNFGPVPQ